MAARFGLTVSRRQSFNCRMGFIMTPAQRDFVQHNWKLVSVLGETAADLFYDRLFEIDPGLKDLFQGVDLASQKKKLLKALAFAVATLEAPQALLP
ncbi:MAG: hypothetical protein VX871_11315, partial [Pseudomonadota bacterium]|nr:hypothetical protein [Pseudomonadota bacterium]